MPLNLPARPTLQSLKIQPISSSIFSAETGRVADPEISKGRNLRNQLTQMQINAYDPQEEKMLENLSIQAKAVGAYLKAIDNGVTQQAATELYKSLGGSDKVNLETKGDQMGISILSDSGDGFKISGYSKDISKISNYLDVLAGNPKAGLSPEMAKALIDNGITVERVKAKKETPREIKTWKTPDGEIKNLPLGALPPMGSVPYKEDTQKGGGNDVEAYKKKEKIKLDYAKQLAEYKAKLKEDNLSEKDKRKFDITIANIEDDLLNPTEEDEDPTAKVDMFNENSDKDYYYRFTPAEVVPGLGNDKEATLEKLPRRKLSQDKAVRYLREAGGDRDLAEKRAKRDGYKF